MSIVVLPVLCGMIQENAYIVSVSGREDCVVVDPGDDFPKLKRAVGSLRVAAILLTHGHFDHIRAAAALAADYHAPVYAAAEEMEMLNDAGLNGFAGLMGVDEMDTPPISARPYGQTLSAAGMDYQILPTPGHSKGSVCLYLQDEGTLFSGDTLFRAGYGRMDLYGGDVNAMVDSLKRLFALPPETRVWPGHGDATTIGEERARYRL